MDGIQTHFTMRTFFSFLLLILLQTSTDAQDMCSAPSDISFPENNAVGDVVQTITVLSDEVTLKITLDPSNAFSLQGNNLIAAKVFDYEAETSLVAEVTCTNTTSGLELGITIIVLLINVNDNPPVFSQSLYEFDVDELSHVDTVVGRVSATDLDGDTIYYTLTSESNGFKLRSTTDAELLVQTPLDYDKVKNVQLIVTAQDAPLTLANGRAPLSATTTVRVTIIDVDNRPPWFQPCSEHDIGGAVICQNSGYTTRVVLNEQETGVLTLKPGPLRAIDGDAGINEEITYSFLGGDAGGLFHISPNTGDITMLKPADVLGTISLTVLATQRTNSHQFATTTVTVSVQVKSLHPPQFQRPQYEGVITAVGVMAKDPTNKDAPLMIRATDEDYTATGGLNPHITYYIDGNDDFSIINGYLFMTKDLPEATLSLQVVAMDTSNEESATAQLSVRVTSGLTTTTLPLSSTGITALTTTGESSTISKTTDVIMSTSISMSTSNGFSTTIPSTSSESGISTTNPSITSEGSISTTNPSLTSEGSTSTASTAHPHTGVTVPSGVYRVEDMAALGATLGVLLLICVVVIVVLALQIQRGKTAWRKIYEASMFQSSLGQGSGGQKEGIQYTNKAFQSDEDGDSIGSGGPAGGSAMASGAARDFALSEAIMKSTVPLHALLRDDTSQAGSDKADSEKEVKPILTKERRMDEGYKSVWFKEDIDPNAKEEVVIIPDSREDDSEEEDDSMGTPTVAFNDTDLDSGLGVKMEDPAEDSERDDVLNVDL